MSDRHRIVRVAVVGLIVAALLMGAAWWFQPKLEDIAEPAREAQTEAEEQGADHSRTVVCNADCQVTFDFSEPAKTPSAENQAAKPDSPGQTREDWEILLQRRDLIAQERMAYWAIWLAGLTALGVVLIAGTFWEAMEATKAANKAAIAASDQTKANNRPRLRVGIVTASTDKAGAFEADRPLICDVGIVNIGRAPAQIVSSFCMRYIGAQLPMYQPYSDRDPNNLFKEIEVLAPGMAAHARISLPALTTDERDMLFQKRTTLFIMGWVRYMDDGIPRRTMFCREFDPAARRFRPTKDSDYEVEN